MNNGVKIPLVKEGFALIVGPDTCAVELAGHSQPVITLPRAEIGTVQSIQIDEDTQVTSHDPNFKPLMLITVNMPDGRPFSVSLDIKPEEFLNKYLFNLWKEDIAPCIEQLRNEYRERMKK